MSLVALFLVSLAAVGYETALTRYFAVAKWSEYGYWVISIVMVGFALSGVVLALWRDLIVRHARPLQAALPALLVLSAATGYHFTTTNPFNPLQLQNPATWQSQLWNIAGYYAALLPFFFLAGLFISLSFVRNASRIGLVYAFDLTGAGAGAAAVLAAMFLVHAFALVPLLLLPLALSAGFAAPTHRTRAIVAAVLALAAAEAVLILDNQADYNDFKAIYAPLHTPDAKIVASVTSPRGDYALLDDFTERVDTDISNNAGMLGVDGPPRTYGLYRDGNRIAALPKVGPLDTGYSQAALDALPYLLIPHARTLLAGASGGFRIAEVLRLGATRVRVLEPEPVLFRALQNGLGPAPPLAALPGVQLTPAGPVTAIGRGACDVVDLSADFLDTADINATAFTQEALDGYLNILAPGGMISIPVSIRDFPVYALRMLATVRAALLGAGIDDPPRHVLVYRSAWNVRILLARDGWTDAQIAAARKFADDRSFDMTWYPGMDIAAARANIYNDLPAVSFDKGEVESTSPDDAIADEAEAILSGRPVPSRAQFNISPITLDKPFFYAVLRLDRIGTILQRLEILPQAEVGALVNLAVLAQAAVIAVLVLLVPLAAPNRVRAPQSGLFRAVLYFPALALGFLFIEIYLIEKASFWLTDRTSGFALVLTGMLIFSGFGSLISSRFTAAPRQGMALAAAVIVAWSIAAALWLEPVILATLDWSYLARAGLLLVAIAPVSVALGLPFPLGLSNAGTSGFLPWAWGLNGAFSVVATPLANLIAREAGFSRVLLCSAILYGIALITFPRHKETFGLARPTRSITRRGVISTAASAAAALAIPHPTRAAPVWTRSAYEQAMHESGRPVSLTDAQFDAIQKRKPVAIKRIEGYLKDRLGTADPAVLAAFQAVPREYFHYDYPEHRATPGDAYEDTPKPWALGYGSALSDYLGQAYMTQICKPAAGEVTLEVGTGSGFQSSLLSRIVKTAYSIEIIEPLGRAVGRIFTPLGYDNVHTRVGDGYYGWPDVKGGFDIIIVTCAATFAPPDLFKQLKPGGRMIIPIGQPFKRGQVLYVYTKDAEGKIHSRRDMGVFFIPMTGAIQKSQPIRPETVSDPHPAADPHATPTTPAAGEAKANPTSE